MIKLENVFVNYENKEVLKNINFEIDSCKNISIIGPNGCGKTTLLKTMCNLLDFKGNVFFKGKNIKQYKVKELAKEIGMLSQITQMYFNYKVFDIVMMGRYIHNNNKFSFVDTNQDIKKVEEALKIVGIYNIKDRDIDTLSGGQMQRVFLAKIIAQDPNIILLDEPTNHLDLSYQIELINFLKKWSKEHNKMIIGVLHDINLAMLLTDNIMLLNNGKIEAFGNIKEILKTDKINQIYNLDIKKYMIETLKKWENM